MRFLISNHEADQSPKIVVEKLTKTVNENHLREIFGAYGPIRDLDMPMNRQCKSLPRDTSILSSFLKPTPVMTNRGTAYILYTDAPDAESAIAHMHEAQLDGAVINVSIVLPRRKFSRSPPPARRVGGPNFDRHDARAPPPPGGYRGPPPGNGGGGGRFRSPPPPPLRRGSPPRRYGGRPDPRGSNLDTYRPRSLSRSRSPRTRSRSYSSRSRSRSPLPRRRGRRDSPPPPPPPARGPRRRRSPSYSSYSSYSDKSRSRSRSRGRYGRGRR